MLELFPNVPEYVRQQTQFWVDIALREDTLIKALNTIQKYIESLDTEENKDYVAFVFAAEMEKRHANFND